MARRHIYLRGAVSKFNKAFGVILNKYRLNSNVYPATFMAHTSPVSIASHISHLVLNVMGLNTQPPKPASYNVPPVTSSQPPSFFKTIYNVPSTSAAGQTIAIGGLYGGYSDSDVVATCARYSIPVPTITKVNMGDPAKPFPPDTIGESTLDISTCVMFGNGAAIGFYWNVNIADLIVSRVTFPQPGDPICNVLTMSFVADEGTIQNDLTPYEDAAINNVAVFCSSGDWGASQAFGVVAVMQPAVYPYVTGVGGTSVGALSGTLSSTNFVEWAWNEQQIYGGVTGGGVSALYPTPSFQKNITIPPTLVTRTSSLQPGQTGRAVPDISGCANPESFPQYYINGRLASGGGTSGSCPMMASFFAVANAVLGYNAGFINPTLYHGYASFMRNLNSGGPPDNSMYVREVGNIPPTTIIPGYSSSTNGWNACCGLGMINIGNFVTYVQSLKKYWVQVQSISSSGTLTSAITGPVFVPAS